jgi:hypothetical protein
MRVTSDSDRMSSDGWRKAKLRSLTISALWQARDEQPSCLFRGCIFIPDNCNALLSPSSRARTSCPDFAMCFPASLGFAVRQPTYA